MEKSSQMTFAHHPPCPAPVGPPPVDAARRPPATYRLNIRTMTVQAHLAWRTFQWPMEVLGGLDHVSSEEIDLAELGVSISAAVSCSAFDAFGHALRGQTIDVTRKNANDLEALCYELGFGGLDAAIAGFRASNPGLPSRAELVDGDGTAEAVVVVLSSGGLERVRLDGSKAPFTFVVDGDEYPCAALTAELISPLITRTRVADQGLESFTLATADPDGLFGVFLGLGYEVAVTAAVRPLFEAFARELGNGELLLAMAGYAPGSLDASNVVGFLRFKHEFRMDADPEVNWLALRFHQLRGPVLDGFSVDEFQAVLSSPFLRIESEDWLAEVIAQRTARYRAFFDLFGFLRFEWVSSAGIETFLGTVGDNAITGAVWHEVMRLFTSQRVDGGSRVLGVEFALVEGAPFNGIIAHLREECGGNVHQEGAVKVTG